MTHQPFIILALPRSRTFWLSRFLTYGGWACYHDELRHARTMEDVKVWFDQPQVGNVETSLSPWWRLIPKYAPNAKLITIRRPVEEVLDSLSRLGFTMNDAFIKSIKMYDRKLDQLEKRLPNVRSYTYDQLNDERVCAEIFEFCLGMKHDHSRYVSMEKMNLQIDMSALLRYYKIYQPQLNKLAKTAKNISINEIKPSEQIEDGITIQEETLDDILRDGHALFAEHALDVGEPPDTFLTKNIPLMHKLDELGYLQVHTARSNGRLFGYLVTLISPSFERQNTLSGVHTFFFTSKDVKNVGMKLQRASIEALRHKGCDEVILRAGIRGSTAGRISTLYKRLGASDFGQLYRLELS